MGLFSKHKHDEVAPAQGTPTGSAFPPPAPASGVISLKKGEGISLTKHSDTISASNGWTAKGKDYDLKGLVIYRDGHQIYVGAANDDESRRTPEGAVSHSGDARGPGELETITIKWHPDIAVVALSSYSALENGQGSFRQYGVYVNIQNGPQTIGLAAADASADSASYTLCFGEVVFTPDGGFHVNNLEMYSKRGSEHRIGYRDGRVVMDIGPQGRTK